MLVRLFCVAAVLSALAGCAQYENRRGVEVAWDAAAVADFRRGETTRQEVMSRLGPPSQLIALEDETVLYYLLEQSRGDGLVLILYNRMQIDTRYDRAVFFFDDNDRLVDFATHVTPRT
ncbi:hypothetical protein [Haliea atlantica]